MTTARRTVLASRPDGAPTADDFRTDEVTLPQVADGELGLAVRYLSLDPYMRGRMSAAKSYAAPVPVGGVMQGESVAEVTVSRHPDFEVGELVRAHTGWCTHAVLPAEHVRTLQTHGAPPTTALGVLGMPGFTAYAGLTVIGEPEQGETVVVAAASGPVGSMVGQLARLAGARVVGIAGGPEKCASVRDELGFDAAVDHRDPDFAQRLAAACPDGVDIYFENVGGAVWDAVLPLLNTFARVPVCGLVSQYNSTGPAEHDRLPATMGAVLTKSLRVRGFIQTEFAEEYYPRFLAEVGPKVADGTIRYREDIVDGFDNAPEAFTGMLEGRNFGKLMVKVS